MERDDMASNPTNEGNIPFVGEGTPVAGIALRDWLAGMALAGFTRVREGEMFNDHTVKWYAKIAYSLADAMLLEREQPQKVSLRRPNVDGQGLWTQPVRGAH